MLLSTGGLFTLFYRWAWGRIALRVFRTVSGSPRSRRIFTTGIYREESWMDVQWARGDGIVLREVWQGRVWSARPITVVEVGSDWIALYLAEGSRWQQPRAVDGGPVTPLTRLEGNWHLRERVHHLGSNLLLIPEGAPYSIQLMWSPGWGQFQGWYVNLQDPLRPSALGFDYMDWLLDMVVAPDLSEWYWKDESEFEEARSLGLISQERAECFRNAGLDALDLIRKRKSLLGTDWENWRPDDAWPIPELPRGWEVVGESQDGES